MFSLFSEFSTVKKVTGQTFHVIFFAENRFYFQYFQHLFEALLTVPGLRIAYITADKEDALLQDKRVEAFYLKNTLAGAFPRLQADVVVMTMPDLQNFIFKKSPSVKKYVYVFHALVSTHQQYRAHAFDHYDAIFCTGPQQVEEVREAEELYNLPQKACIAYGYPLLTSLKEKSRDVNVAANKILIAPSWYAEGILSTCILPLVTELAKADYQVWIRPHPEFVKRNKKAYAQLQKLVAQNKAVHFDSTPSVYTHLLDAGHLVTDRSGIAMEYAMATQRPVLFIDTPPKIQNPEVGRFSIAPVENAFRESLGVSVLPERIGQVGEALHQLKSSAAHYRTSIQLAEQALVYPPAFAQNGLDFILENLTL